MLAAIVQGVRSQPLILGSVADHGNAVTVAVGRGSMVGRGGSLGGAVGVTSIRAGAAHRFRGSCVCSPRQKCNGPRQSLRAAHRSSALWRRAHHSSGSVSLMAGAIVTAFSLL